MTNFLDTLGEINSVINDFIWIKVGLVLLIGSGIFMSFCNGFFQITHLKTWISKTIGSMFHKNVISHSSDSGSISPFQALCTALAATIGTGNIAGVASAIVTGGPGAIFWMWIAAFFGMMTNYSENTLGIYYRRRNSDNEWSGGAMYYLQDGLGSYKGCKKLGKILAVLFACFATLASFGIGNIGQVNKIVENFVSAFDVKFLSSRVLYEGVTLYNLIIGLVCVALVGLIVLGGLKRIASFAEKVVPFMVILYLIGSITVVVINYKAIIPAIAAIFTTAFKPIAVTGGVLGYVISVVVTQGFKRGAFSNEAGLGSSVMVHSNSTVKEPITQGMWGIFEVFIDTIVVCTLTALVILTSGVYDLSTGMMVGENTKEATLVASAFNSVFSFFDIGQKFIAVALFLFAFTTILGWSHYGSKCIEYLFNGKAVIYYKSIFVLMTVSGALMTSALAWEISDTFNGFMMVPNLIGVLSLFPLVRKITKNYVDRRIKGKKDVEPLLSYDPDVQKAHAEEVKKGAD